MNSSYTSSWMISRVPETHVWPDATNAANAAPLTALTTSASLKTTIGACGMVSVASSTSGPVGTYLPAELRSVRR
jgi:hypothetical protein